MAAVSGKLLPRKIADTPRHIANITASKLLLSAGKGGRFRPKKSRKVL